MRRVQRSELLDYATWTDGRGDQLAAVLEAKRRRRVHLGPALTFLFENHETVRYQVQEMMRVERLVRESEIAHELETYNELLGGPGELGCTLLIEIDDPDERARRLAEWIDLPAHLYLRLEDGGQAWASVDERQRDERKLSSVQFLKFKTGGAVPVSIGCALPALEIEQPLSEEQRAALREDLADG